MDQRVPLTRYRRDKSLTLSTLAEQLGISEGHLSRVERFGTANFKLALNLAEITGLPVETFRPSDEAER